MAGVKTLADSNSGVKFLKKRKTKDLTKVRKLPLLILFGIIFLLIGVLQTQQYVPAFEQLGELTICFFGFYAVIIFFNFVNKCINKIFDKKLKVPVVTPENMVGDSLTETIEETPKKEKKIEKLLSKIVKKKEKKVNEEKVLKVKKNVIVVVEVLYIIVQLYLIASMALSSFSYNLKIISLQQYDYTFGNIGFLVVLAVCLLVYRAFILQKTEAKASKTVSMMFLTIGGMSLIYVGFCVLNIILEMDFSNITFWFYRIATIYVAIVLLFDIFITVIKKETLKDFNYNLYIPDLKNLKNKKGENRKSILEILEEHTGISLKSLWSLKYVNEVLPAAVLAILAVLLVASCVYKVEPYEQAAVYRLGALEETSIKGEGLHLKLPWPIEKTEIYEVKRVQNMTIGYESNDTMDNMWTESHSVEEYKLLTGNGNELVSVNIKLIYKIDDLYTYLTKSSSPEQILSSKAYEFMMNKTNSTDLYTILSVDRTDLSKELLKALNAYTKEYKVGLTVEEVIVESIHPPVELSDVYQSVVSADVKKTTTITNAESEALSIVLDAEKDAETVVITAKENQTTKVADATKEMSVYKAALEAYKESPKSFKLSKYLDTYEKVIGGNKVYVFSPNIDSELSQYIINASGNSGEEITVIEAEE